MLEYNPPAPEGVEPDYEYACSQCRQATLLSGLTCEEIGCVDVCHDTRSDADDAADRAHDEGKEDRL